jgi:integrase
MPKRKKSRAKKGTIAIHERNGMLRLRWRYQGQEKHLALGVPDTPMSRHIAQLKANEIEADILKGEFDPTLDRYRDQAGNPTPIAPSTVELFDQFIAYKVSEGLSGQAVSAKYNSLRANIERLGKDVQSIDDARDLVELLISHC